jgi:Cdc6-like AAA superfamily ATPase
MTILGVDQEKLGEVLGRHLTPSAHISTPERLFGRGKKLTQIHRAFASSGRHVFIYGDRGVGKTSLAMTAAHLHQSTAEEPVYVLCSESSTFSELIYAVGINALPLKERMEAPSGGAALGASFAGFGAQYKAGEGARAVFQPPQDINAATDIIRYINTRRNGTTVVVIDELERLKSDPDKIKIAEFINSISSVQNQTKFILSGIGHTVEDLLGAHPSATRKLETIKLDPIPHNELWAIVSTVATELGVVVSQKHLTRSSILSDGFPHYVHLIAESLFWAMFEDGSGSQTTTDHHFREAVKGALERTEVEHKAAYRKATEKLKNTKEYEMALWALADKTESRRQLEAIYEESYKRIDKRLSGERMDRNQLNHRLLRLKTESHGGVVVGYGSGWFAFRESIMRGYVRLVAEDKGVPLAEGLAS